MSGLLMGQQRAHHSSGQLRLQPSQARLLP
jgi:hypothetical protein